MEKLLQESSIEPLEPMLARVSWEDPGSSVGTSLSWLSSGHLLWQIDALVNLVSKECQSLVEIIYKKPGEISSQNLS